MILAVCMLLICTSLVCVLCTRKMINDKTIENMTFNSVSNPVEVKIGDKSIADYVIVYEAGNRRAATDLRAYIYGVSGKKLRISMIKPSDCYIKLDVNTSSISIPVIEQPSLKYERLNKYSPVVAFTIDETISNTIPPITDTGIRDFLRNGINLLRVFPTSNEPNPTSAAKT